MNYEVYKEHQKKAEARDDLECDCADCQRYRRAFADQLDAERLSGD